ncbi:MAG: RHS repeat-associated core domain-containing protein, partial [Chloroflexi bacterium]|nr:RHS repeat-associated core domain-containing protein [Chloroflexota bacterium]
MGDRLTDRGFTGHKENRDIGLTYMNARFYVPGIGRFASADTIVPNPASPQSFNRYSYVLNSPL